ncbi:ATP-grasp domain-containing protein [Paenibacillus sp. A3M_27_13]|nr:ATP-grasp domain-containing protein [Paenibacillus sp. A3M_27_13]
MRHSTQQDEYILDGTLVIEEYIDDGEEYSVEVLTTNGRHEVLAITTKEVVMPYFIEAGHLLPAPLKMEDREAIQETVCSLLTSIGHLEGPSHTEIKLRRGIPYIIESHTIRWQSNLGYGSANHRRKHAACYRVSFARHSLCEREGEISVLLHKIVAATSGRKGRHYERQWSKRGGAYGWNPSNPV